MFEPKPSLPLKTHTLPPFDPELLLRDDEHALRSLVRRVASALVAQCPYCVATSPDVCDEAPVACALAGLDGCPRKVSVERCLECGEYKRGS